jgi:hypothetical protein
MGARHVVDDAENHSWVGGLLRRFICGLGGHELMRSFAPGRISLRCVSCPYESPGWVLKESRQLPARRGRPALVAQNAR